MGYIYLYGQILTSQSFLLCEEYPKADSYSEIKKRYFLLGGETGISAAILTSLGCNVTLGGSHLGDENKDIILDYFKDKSADTSKLFHEKGFRGVMDCVIIDKNTRTCFGQFNQLGSRDTPYYEHPDEESIKNCTSVGTDPFFGESIVELCRKYNKKYATIDCDHDSDMNKYCSVNAVSHEYLDWKYQGKDYREIYQLYTENTDGLIIFTFGGKEIMYGRKGQEPKYFKPYRINVVSTLGAGDSFKAGTIYALDKGMSDDEMVSFACATAGVACESFPIPLNLPTLDKIERIRNSR